MTAGHAPGSGSARLGLLRVGERMQAGLPRCAPETPLATVAALLAETGSAFVLVSGASETGPSGWAAVSDLDLLAAALVRALDDQIAAGSATRPRPTVSSEDSLERAAQLMLDSGVGRLLVIDPVGGEPVGTITSVAIAAAVAG